MYILEKKYIGFRSGERGVEYILIGVGEVFKKLEEELIIYCDNGDKIGKGMDIYDFSCFEYEEEVSIKDVFEKIKNVDGVMIELDEEYFVEINKLG